MLLQLFSFNSHATLKVVNIHYTNDLLTQKYVCCLNIFQYKHKHFSIPCFAYFSLIWPVTKPCLQRLQRNDRAMIRQICNVKPQDTATIRSIELLAQLGIEDLDLILKERRLRWYGHVERSNGAVKTAFDIQVNGKRGPGRPKMTWKQLTERNPREWKLSAINPHDRDTWRSGVRSAMCAASQLPGRGPTVVDMAPIPAR